MRQSLFPQCIQYADGYFHQRKTNPSGAPNENIVQTTQHSIVKRILVFER